MGVNFTLKLYEMHEFLRNLARKNVFFQRLTHSGKLL